MSEVCPTNLQNQHIAELAALQTEVSNLKEEVKVLGSIEQAITRMTTLFEIQTTTLERMDKKIDKTDEKIDNLEKKFIKGNELRVSEKIEDKKNKTEIIKARISFYSGLISVIGLIVVAFIK